MNYELKTIYQDFIVKEVSLEPELFLKENSKFTYFLLKKIGLSTFDALEKIINYFQLTYKDISQQGLKDEDGVAFQTISIEKIISEADILKFNRLYNRSDCLIQIEKIIGYGNKAVKPASLYGNIFHLTIRNLTTNEAEVFNNYFGKNKLISFVNYYDCQRFGLIGNKLNSFLIGKSLVENNWEEAYQQFKISGRPELIPENLLESNVRNNIKDFFKQMNPARIDFFISSYNSWLWNYGVNNYFQGRKKSKKNNFFLIGDLFLPQDIGSDLKNIFTISGFKINPENFKVTRVNRSRSVVCNTKIFILSKKEDEIYKGREKITISFFLPTGSYATMLVSQLFFQLDGLK